MPQRKIQLRRSATIYQDLSTAILSLNATLANNLNLQDGEMVIARYLVNDDNNQDTVKGVLGLYNDKNNHKEFTVFVDANEYNRALTSLSEEIDNLDSVIDGIDVSFNVENVTDTNVQQTTDDDSRVITSLTQENGQVYVGETAAKDLLLTGFQEVSIGGSIEATDTIEDALNKLEYAISEIDIDLHSNSESVLITDDVNGGKNFEVNFDNSTIVQGNNHKLKTNLEISKKTTNLPSNVREQYELVDGSGNVIGDAINIYKDSSLKEVFIGTQYDTVDSQTGEVTNKRYLLYRNYNTIHDDTYNQLNQYQQAIYTLFSSITYTVIYDTITAEEYEQLTESQKELYTAQDATRYHIINETLYEDEYNSLTEEQKSLYDSGHNTNTYQVNDEYITLSLHEYTLLEFEKEPMTINLYLDMYDDTNEKDYFQSLNFVYHLDDGSYELVRVDISKFLSETEFTDGLIVYGPGNVAVKIDPTDEYLSVSSDGIKIDLSTITTNVLNGVSGGSAIEVSQKTNNQQTINLKLAERVGTSTDSNYGGLEECSVDETTGEESCTTLSTNILQIYDDGLFLDSSWDCGEY